MRFDSDVDTFLSCIGDPSRAEDGYPQTDVWNLPCAPKERRKCARMIAKSFLEIVLESSRKSIKDIAQISEEIKVSSSRPQIGDPSQNIT